MAHAGSIEPPFLEPNIPEALSRSLLSLRSFADVAALVNSGCKVLPSQFVVPEQDRPGLAHDAFLPDFDLPVFDLSLFAACQTPEERNQMASRLSTICKEWGIFHLVNHGVEAGVMKQMESIGRSFFDLPTSTKEKAKGYSNKFDSSMQRKNWVEGVTLVSTPESFGADFIDLARPGESQEFRDCFEKYVDNMEEICRTMIEVLMESLGVKASTLTQEFSPVVRFNHYPPCPQPALAMGLTQHTDSDHITILFQDEVGGLQILGKDGEWRAVKPNADALIVNVGDLLMVLSNGAYHSVTHRAVLNSTEARLSLVYFYSCKEDAIIRPHEDLVDAKHPPRFKACTYSEFMRDKLSFHGKDPGNKNVVLLDDFASI